MNIFKKIARSFSARLTTFLLTVTAILFIAAICVTAFSSQQLIKEEASRGAENILKSTVSDIEETITSVESSTLSTAWLVKEKKDDPNFMYTLTKQLVDSNPHIIGSTVAFIPNFYPQLGEYFAPYSYKDEGTGKIISFQMGNEDYDYHTMEWFQMPYLLKQQGWSEPYYDEGGGEQMMTTFSVPIMDDDGDIFAVMTADISLKKLTEQVAATKPYPNAYTILVSNNASYISHPISERILNETIFSNALSQGDTTLLSIAYKIVGKETGKLEFKDEGGIQSLAVYRPISNGWSVVLVCPLKDVLEKTLEMNLILVLVLLFGLVLLALLCWLTVRRLTRPLSEFCNSANDIAKGNFNSSLPRIKSHDEMRQLHDSFAHMQRSLTNYISELKTTTSAKERIDSELNLARNIQLNMVSKDFRENLYAILNPAKEVGGDLYDFNFTDGKIKFAIGDVSGKGVPAALLMAITRSAFMFMEGLGLNVQKIISRINNTLSRGNKQMLFVTMFAGMYNPKTKILSYCNAGHNPIVIIEPPKEEGGEPNAFYLKAKPNLVLGLMADFEYEGEEIEVEHGSRIILYTDGVTEAENAANEQYGEDRLLEFARKAFSIPTAKECTEALLAEVHAFADGNPQNDDITILTVDV